MKKRCLIITSLTLITFCLYLLGPTNVWAKKTDLTIMTAPPGGLWFTWGTAIMQIFQKNIPELNVSVAPGGGISNQVAIESGRAKIGFCHTPTALLGWRGEAPFKAPTRKVRWFCTVGKGTIQFVTLKEKGIEGIFDLKGKRFATLVKGNAGELASRWVLELYGLSYKDMSTVSHGSFSDLNNMLRDGHADSISFVASVPFGVVMQIAATKPVHLLSLDTDKVQALCAKNPGYAPDIIKAGTYRGQDDQVKTASQFFGCLVSEDLPEDLVYRMAKALIENADQFISSSAPNKWMNPKEIAKNNTGGVVPFHAGALKLYKEKGLID